MPNTQQTLIKFFTLILDQDENVLRRISKFEGDMYIDQESSMLVFKLSALHQFFRCEIKLDYAEFLKIIYQGSINEELLALGGRVEVHHSSGKIHDSYYRLVKTG